MGIRNLTISLDGVAIGRVTHINVYDEGDLVQVKGGNSFSVVFPSYEKGGQAPPGSIFLTATDNKSIEDAKNRDNRGFIARDAKSKLEISENKVLKELNQ